MLPFLFLACYRVADPFHISTDTSIVSVDSAQPEDSGNVGPDSGNTEPVTPNTHYLRLGEVVASESHLSFESPIGGWLQPYSHMQSSWSLSMKLPHGIQDPSELSTEETSIQGWMVLKTPSMWLGINLQGCEITYGNTGNYSESYSLQNSSGGCEQVAGTIAIGKRLTISFEPLISAEPASLQIAVLIDDEFLGQVNVDFPTISGEPRMQIGGFVMPANNAGILAPVLELDQLIIAPEKFGGAENLVLSQAATNDLLNDLKEQYVAHFFPLGEGDSCPEISEYVDDFISGRLINADCDSAFQLLE